MHLILVRHGQSFVNLPDWEGGFIDAGLTPLGQQQAQLAADWLADHVAPDAVYASSMRRAVETAERIAAGVGMPFVQDHRLREVGNAWPDATPIDVSQEAPQWSDFWASERPFSPISDGGETWMDFITRVGRSLYEIADRHEADDDTVLVVCHGGVINAAVDIAFNIGPWRSLDAWVHNTSITHLEYKPPNSRQEMWRLHGLNICYHLMQPDGAILGYEWKGRVPAK
jgi:broad specificity phosphatase PhoE